MKITKKRLISSIAAVVSLIGVVGVGFAAFSDRGDVYGTSVTVGSADIKLLDDVAGTLDESNLVDEKFGPLFEDIDQDWSDIYPVKLFNNGSSQLSLFSSADYETSNDPSDLREEIEVEFFPWSDDNNDGLVDAGELGTSVGKKTVVKWKTQGFDLGLLDTGEVRGFVVEFSTQSLPVSNQGASFMFDFGFDSAAL